MNASSCFAAKAMAVSTPLFRAHITLGAKSSTVLFNTVNSQKSLGFTSLHTTSSLSQSSFGRESAVCYYSTSSVLAPKKYVTTEESDVEEENDDGGLDISKLDVEAEIIHSLRKRGITKLFPIQRAVLEPAMQGRDIIGRARTGTGKTLAFGVPILNKILLQKQRKRVGGQPLALVLAPTRELASQVEKEFSKSASNIVTLCCYGGVSIEHQISALRKGLDVVVGTPGRIIDLLNRGSLNLSQVQSLVLDEADQMLDVGFEKDVERIMQRLPKVRQSMLFSATMPVWVDKLSKKYLKSPVVIDIVGKSTQKLADTITLYSIAASAEGKRNILSPLITKHANKGKCIVFTKTKRGASNLAKAMQGSFRCEALHGNITQNKRERTLQAFRDSRFNVLIATDVAARGLDVPNVELIIHYDLPNTSELFVHRSGRTGRAGRKGTTILIYGAGESRDVRTFEKDTGCRFQQMNSKVYLKN